MAMPGLSTTFVLVLTGPECLVRTYLIPLARRDPGVAGTMMVAVASVTLNHIPLFVF